MRVCMGGGERERGRRYDGGSQCATKQTKHCSSEPPRAHLAHHTQRRATDVEAALEQLPSPVVGSRGKAAELPPDMEDVGAGV